MTRDGGFWDAPLRVHATYDEGVAWVNAGEEGLIPEQFEVRLVDEDDDSDDVALVSVKATQFSENVVTLALEAHVSAELLSVPQLLRYGMNLVAKKIVKGENDRSKVERTLHLDPDEFYSSEMWREPRRRPRRQITDDFLKEIADVYRGHRGSTPNQEIAKRYDAPISTAAYWVQRARRAGFLGRALGGRAGEAVQQVDEGAREEEAEIVKRYRQGASIRKVAAEYGRSYGAVHRILTNHGVELRGRGGDVRHAVKYDPEFKHPTDRLLVSESITIRQAHEIQERYHGGESVDSIAESTGVSEESIHRLLIEQGIKLRGRDAARGRGEK